MYIDAGDIIQSILCKYTITTYFFYLIILYCLVED